MGGKHGARPRGLTQISLLFQSHRKERGEKKRRERRREERREERRGEEKGRERRGGVGRGGGGNDREGRDFPALAKGREGRRLTY